MIIYVRPTALQVTALPVTALPVSALSVTALSVNAACTLPCTTWKTFYKPPTIHCHILAVCAVPSHLPTVCTDEPSSLLLGTSAAVPFISSQPLDTVTVMFTTHLPTLRNNSNFQFYKCWQCNVTVSIGRFLHFPHYLIFTKEHKISVNGCVHAFSWQAPTQSPGLFNLSVKPKSTVAPPKIHLTTKNRFSSQTTALSTDTERSYSFILYLPGTQGDNFPNSTFEKWEGKRSPYGCTQNYTHSQIGTNVFVFTTTGDYRNCTAATIAVAVSSNLWHCYWQLSGSQIIELIIHYSIQ